MCFKTVGRYMTNTIRKHIEKKYYIRKGEPWHRPAYFKISSPMNGDIIMKVGAIQMTVPEERSVLKFNFVEVIW